MPECKPRYATKRTPERQNLLHLAEKIAAELGWQLMPWQKEVLAVATELDAKTGKLVYREVIVTVPRQNGKSTLVLVLMLLRAGWKPKQEIIYGAQSRKDARKKLIDEWLPELQARSIFGKQVTPRLSNGNEQLSFKNRSYITLVASTAKSGHGGHVDLAIIDEGFAYEMPA